MTRSHSATATAPKAASRLLQGRLQVQSTLRRSMYRRSLLPDVAAVGAIQLCCGDAYQTGWLLNVCAENLIVGRHLDADPASASGLQGRRPYRLAGRWTCTAGRARMRTATRSPGPGTGSPTTCCTAPTGGVSQTSRHSGVCRAAVCISRRLSAPYRCFRVFPSSCSRMKAAIVHIAARWVSGCCWELRCCHADEPATNIQPCVLLSLRYSTQHAVFGLRSYRNIIWTCCRKACGCVQV